MQQVTLAILAGGKSSRLGGIDKALIAVDGIPLINRIYNTFKNDVSEVIVISNGNNGYPIEAKIFPDIIKNCGPLGGIHSALTHANNPVVFVVSVDMPFVNNNVFHQLLNLYFQANAEVVVPMHGNLLEPLFGLYSTALEPKVRNILSDMQGHPITDLLNAANTHYLQLPDDFKTRMWFYNINTPDDLKALEL
ncbi:MAG: molybdenum cofactor guanylyltransferase [Bacteroidota bacterium]